ncbi:NAD-glutamate dehydrogenase, partial [Arthrobacter deserti]|nr:NAD-glutamate dehydrogenase [Arthrobacter deserti]
MSSGTSMADLLGTEESADEFIANYYEHLAQEDAENYTPELLQQRAYAHRNLARRRGDGQAVVGVFHEAHASVVMIVTDDMPFLVDSVMAEIVRQELAIRLLNHPIFVATRNRGTHELVDLRRVPAHAGISSGDTAALPSLSAHSANRDNATFVESWIAVETEKITGEEQESALVAGLLRILEDVRVSVQDWPAMRRKVREIADSLDAIAGAEQIPDLQEAKALLDW